MRRRTEGAFSVLSKEHRACVALAPRAPPPLPSERSNAPRPLAPFRSFYIGFDRGGHPVYLEYFGATQWLKARRAPGPA